MGVGNVYHICKLAKAVRRDGIQAVFADIALGNLLQVVLKAEVSRIVIIFQKAAVKLSVMDDFNAFGHGNQLILPIWDRQRAAGVALIFLYRHPSSLLIALTSLRVSELVPQSTLCIPIRMVRPDSGQFAK